MSTHAPRAQVRPDHVVPVRQQPRGHVLQRLGARPGLGRQRLVAGVGELRVLRLGSDRRRRRVVGAAPGHELQLAGFLLNLRLVPALQRTVVVRIEPPRPPDTDPVPVAFGQREVSGADRPPLHGGMRKVGKQAVPGEQLAARPLSVRRPRSAPHLPSRRTGCWRSTRSRRAAALPAGTCPRVPLAPSRPRRWVLLRPRQARQAPGLPVIAGRYAQPRPCRRAWDMSNASSRCSGRARLERQADSRA